MAPIYSCPYLFMQIKTGFKPTKQSKTFKTSDHSINENILKASIRYEQVLPLIIILPSGQK